jgi:hypothetical protein
MLGEGVKDLRRAENRLQISSTKMQTIGIELSSEEW